MMVETAVAVVVVLSTHNTALFVRALIQMEAGVEQLAHLLQQRPLIQVICTSIKLVRNIFLIQVLYCIGLWHFIVVVLTLCMGQILK